MNRTRAAGVAAALLGLSVLAWGAHSTTQHATVDPQAALTPDPEQAGNEASSAAVPARPAAPAVPPPSTTTTPMAERIAVLGVLNKRDGLTRDISLHPGQSARFGDLIVRLRACETTADWEPEQLTGAFVQADLRQTDGTWKRIFSGWLYKETPSLNVVENGLYDVWPKSCTMRHPDMGPATVSAAGAPARSIAKKSAAPAPAEAPEPSPSASSNSIT